MNTNRVTGSVSGKDQETVPAAIATIRQSFPFLIDLTMAERVAMAKLGDKSQGFAKRALEVATQHPNKLPPMLLEGMRADMELLESFAPIRIAIDLLQKQVDDTATQIGAQVYAAARTVYAVSKAPFAEAAFRTAAADLSKRFGRRSREADSAEAAPAGQKTTTISQTP